MSLVKSTRAAREYIIVGLAYTTIPQSYIAGRIKTLLLRRKNDCFGDKFGMLRQPLRLAAVATAIEKAQ